MSRPMTQVFTMRLMSDFNFSVPWQGDEQVRVVLYLNRCQLKRFYVPTAAILISNKFYTKFLMVVRRGL